MAIQSDRVSGTLGMFSGVGLAMQLVALPILAIAAAVPSVAQTSVPAQTSPAYPQTTFCGNRSLEAQFETEQYLISICAATYQESPLLVTVDKTRPSSQTVLPVEWQGNVYIAYNGNIVYRVNANQYLVTETGRITVNQPVLNSYFGSASTLPAETRYDCFSQVYPYSDRYDVTQEEAQRLQGLLDGNLFVYQCRPQS